jgi:hypothetical protein
MIATLVESLYMAVTVLRILCTLSHSILATTLKGEIIIVSSQMKSPKVEEINKFPGHIIGKWYKTRM